MVARRRRTWQLTALGEIIDDWRIPFSEQPITPAVIQLFGKRSGHYRHLGPNFGQHLAALHVRGNAQVHTGFAA